MARIRSIKPEMPSDKKLARLSFAAQLTFVYLITQVDDDGLVYGEPRQLLGVLFPHNQDVTPGRLEGWLNELRGIDAIAFRHTQDGSRVVELTKWLKHQRVKNPSPSKISPLLVKIPGTLPPSAGEPTEPLPEFWEPILQKEEALLQKEEALLQKEEALLQKGTAEVEVGVGSRIGKGEEEGRVPPMADTFSLVIDTTGEKKETAPPPSKLGARCAEIWKTHIGAPAYGRIGAAIKQVLLDYPIEMERDVEEAFLRYCTDHKVNGRAQFASPQDFAAKYQIWSRVGPSSLTPRRPGVSVSAGAMVAPGTMTQILAEQAANEEPVF